jgi:methionyl-tRNA synthetase
MFAKFKFAYLICAFKVQEVIDKSGKAVKVSSESGHLVERTSETNYMFRLSEFKQKLRGYLNGKVVVPQKYQDLLYSQIDALDDLSVSRERKRVHWGIPVNFILSQVTISFHL